MASPIRIAHISDLHFGLKGQSETWSLLANHLNNPPHDLILITGDIADSTDEKLFAKAQKAVEELLRRPDGTTTPCCVCPGNHDRFWHGNRLWKLNPLRYIWRPKKFEDYFHEFMPSLSLPKDITVGPADNEWKLRILALDSSREADRFARGKISLQEVQSIAQTMLRSDNIDLGLMLVHHHVLSVRALENSSQRDRLRLLQLTALTNSGSLLEALASAHVDIVLHGHEHKANWGRYATLTGGGGTTTVIAAGSATGVTNSVKCEQEEASYNLIELWPNRSVNFTIRGWNARWFDVGKQYVLFEPEDVRRSRALRRSGQVLEGLVSSEIVKSVRFTRDGNGEVQESRSDWVIENNKWTLMVSNDTGIPKDLHVSFMRPNGAEYVPQNMVFQALPRANQHDPHQFYFACDVDPQLASESLRVRLSYTWLGGAVLTAEEMGIVKNFQDAGPLREQGYEFAAATAVSSLKSLRLVVEVPPEFAPEDNQVQVFQQDASGRPDQFSSPPDLSNCLRIIRTGLYALTVPYPLKNYRYVVAWQPPQSTPSNRARRFAQAVRNSARNFAHLFHQLVVSALGDDLISSLYLPNSNRLSRLDLVSSWPDGFAPRPAAVDLHNSQIMTLAWRGSISTSGLPEDRLSTDDAALGLLADEHALIAVPVRVSEAEDFAPPWGVVRIAVLKASTRGKNLLALPNVENLQEVLERAILKALLEFDLF